jgi:DsbC/DsbD-like thiol-disulfide interchange protein/cytochrome c biogenesis protein CcdA
MRNRFSSLIALCLTAGAALAQSQAKAELFTRVEGDVVRAAVRIEVAPGWHIYHGPKQSDLGHEKAVGKPTVLTLKGTGVTWSEVRYPAPVRVDQSEIEPGVFILAHEGTVALYAAGRLAPSVKGEDVAASLSGLVCKESCLPVRAELATKGAGPDELFAAFPKDLAAPPAASAEAAPSPAAGATASPPPTPQTAEPVPTEDEKKSGDADAKLYTRVEGRTARAAIEIAIDEGFHLYHSEKGNDLGVGLPTKIELHGSGIRWKAPVWPAPVKLDQSEVEPGAWILAHSGTIVVYAEGELENGATGEGRWAKIKGQTCDDEGCLLYDETLADQGRGSDGLFGAFPTVGVGSSASSHDPVTVDAGDPATAATASRRASAVAASLTTHPDWYTDEDEGGLLFFIGQAILWGLITLLMPCTYPMIPITISFFTKQADKRGGNVLSLALAYGAGIVLIFVVIGLAFGSVIIPFATHWITNLVIGVVFVYFSLTLFGLVDLQPPRFLMNMAGRASTHGGLLGVFLMGAALVITSFTCTAPFVGTLLGSAAGRSIGEVALGMALFGLTMALPFVFLALVPGRIKKMPRSGEWMNTLKFSLGFVELAAALKFLSNADVVRDWQILSREVFLIAWGVLAVLLALYLFGATRLFGRPATLGAKRVAFGVLSLAFALYCFWGLPRTMDQTMTAIIPPYSGGRISPALYTVDASWPIVVDDFDRAAELAREERKLLLVNFTGHT